MHIHGNYQSLEMVNHANGLVATRATCKPGCYQTDGQTKTLSSDSLRHLPCAGRKNDRSLLLLQRTGRGSGIGIGIARVMMVASGKHEA